MPNYRDWPSTRLSLLEQIRDRHDEDAWFIFDATYRPLVYWYCRKSNLRDSEAEDVAQQVMTNIVQSKFEYQPEKGRFRSWLKTVARREIHRFMKKQNRAGRGDGGGGQDVTLQNVESSGTDAEWEEMFNARLLESALDRIRPEFNSEHWRAFEAVAFSVGGEEEAKRFIWVDDPSPVRVASDLGRPIGWVYKVKSKIMKRLEAEIGFLGDDLPMANIS